MKKSFTAIAIFTLFSATIMLCSDPSEETSVRLGKVSPLLINSFPNIEKIEPIKLDCHTPARNEALTAGLTYGGVTSLGMAGALWLCTDASPSIITGISGIAGLCLTAGVGALKYKAKKESLLWLQDKFWNPLVKKYNKAADKINKLDPQLKQLIAAYGIIGPKERFYLRDQYLEENPTARKEIYKFILDRNQKSNQNLYTLVKTQNSADLALLKPCKKEIKTIIYACHEGPKQNYWKEYLRAGNRKKLKEFTRLTRFYDAEDPLDPINKEKIEALDTAIENGGVHQRYLELERASCLTTSALCFRSQSAHDFNHCKSRELHPEFTKIKTADEITMYRERIQEAEQEIKNGDISSLSLIRSKKHTKPADYRNYSYKQASYGYTSNIFIHNKAVELYHDQKCDEMFSQYLPKPSPENHMIPKDVLAKLLSNNELKLKILPTIKICNTPKETALHLKDIANDYQNNLVAIEHWQELVQHCDPKAASNISHSLLRISFDQQQKPTAQQKALTQTLAKHKNAVQEFVKILQETAQVVERLPDSTEEKTIEQILKSITRPDNWQCRHK